MVKNYVELCKILKRWKLIFQREHQNIWDKNILDKINSKPDVSEGNINKLEEMLID